MLQAGHECVVQRESISVVALHGANKKYGAVFGLLCCQDTREKSQDVCLSTSRFFLSISVIKELKAWRVLCVFVLRVLRFVCR